MTEGLTVALWPVFLSHPVTSLDTWAKLVEEKILEAKGKGADIILMPEYASEQWLHFAPKGLKPTEQVGWMAEQTPAALPLVQALAKKHQMLIVSGTFPAAVPANTPPVVNRAHVFFPDGKTLQQDKMCLTPKEKNPEGWSLSTGDSFRTFEWKGYRCCVIICLDIELPALSARISSEKIDLILVPSMTKKLAGYHRVFDCAKARAVELQAAVACVGVIGGAPGREPNIAGAAVFLPCEEALGHTGTLVRTEPSYKANGAGELVIAQIPLKTIHALRQGGAEVWPGAWTADHVKFG